MAYFRTGMTRQDWCYGNPNLQPQDAEGYPMDWPADASKRGFRLPTEEEWEFACRSGTSTPYFFGSDRSLLGRYAWYQKNSGEWMKPVAILRPNPRGLFDMHGGVYEWCQDAHPIDPTVQEKSGYIPGDPATHQSRRKLGKIFRLFVVRPIEIGRHRRLATTIWGSAWL